MPAADPRALSDDPADYLAPTRFLDFDVPAVAAVAEAAGGGEPDAKARAVRLYDRVRDAIRYDPYAIDLTPAGMRASRCLISGPKRSSTLRARPSSKSILATRAEDHPPRSRAASMERVARK